MQPFKNIFFDLGGVLFNLNPRTAFCKFHELGMPVPESILNNDKPLNGFPTGHELTKIIHQVDLGNILAPQFVEIVRSLCHPDVTDAQICEAYNSMIDIPASRLALLKRLRTKYKVYLLSNIGDIHWEAACRMARDLGYPMEDCFDHCFCSYQLHLSKPDPAIFERVIRESGVNPAESLYIDDFIENIEAGRRAGLLAYKITGNTLEEHVPLLFPEFA